MEACQGRRRAALPDDSKPIGPSLTPRTPPQLHSSPLRGLSFLALPLYFPADQALFDTGRTGAAVALHGLALSWSLTPETWPLGVNGP